MTLSFVGYFKPIVLTKHNTHNISFKFFFDANLYSEILRQIHVQERVRIHVLMLRKQRYPVKLKQYEFRVLTDCDSHKGKLL